MRALYISYDGMTDPLGRSQVLPYLQGLAARGHEITLLSCEKRERIGEEATARSICDQAGIDWQPIRYHKRPPILSSMIDVGAMTRHAAMLHRRRGFDLVHCRSYMPAMVGLWLKRKFSLPFLFDMRGFWADERVERRIWPSGNPLFKLTYLYFKRRERAFFRGADAVVSLTNAARDELLRWPGDLRPRSAPAVIPCCVDLTLFNPKGGAAREAGRRRLGLDNEVPVLIYVGSVGGAYLVREMFQLFRVYKQRRAGARFLFVTGHSRTEIENLGREQGVEPQDLILLQATREEVPALVAAADLGVSFILPTFSAIASCPTKFGEMLAMGVPVIANVGVGDIAEIIRDTAAGAVVRRYDEQSLAAAIADAEAAGKNPTQIRAAAANYFALEDGVQRYDAIYRAIGRAA